MDENQLEEYYQILNIDKSASIEEIEQSYFKLVGKKLTEGKKEELANIKLAYHQLIEYLQKKQEQEQEQQQKEYQQHIANLVNNHLKNTRIRVKVKSERDHLKIIINARLAGNQKKATTLIYNILQYLQLPSVQKVKLIAIKADRSLVWEEDLIVYQDINQVTNIKDRHQLLLQQAEKNTNTYALPFAFLIAFGISFAEPLAWFIGMWVHEFGHGTIAWFSGYRAMVTFAGTVTMLERSHFVYFGILFLLGLLFYSGWKEQKKSAMVIAVILVITQFILTWVVSRSTYRMLLSFGGIGGEFYLSTLLIIAFYFKLPEKLHWEFWRYFCLIIGSVTFCSSFSKWNNISLGKDRIPWGTFWGGRGDSGGDLNILNQEFGWSSTQIIDTYNFLGDICLFIMIGFYFYFLTQSYPHWWFYIRKKFLRLGSK